MKNTQNFTEGGIFGPLVRFALPVLAALFLQTMYGAVDLLVVGQLASSADVSAVATGSMIMATMTLAVTGLAMGLTVLIGRKIGENRQEEAGQIIGAGIWLFALMAIALSILMILLATPIARLMRAPAEAFDKTVSYITICSAGTVFIVAFNLVGSIFRGLGNSTLPLVTVAIACVVNILGDLLLVAGFSLGTAGVAIATVFAQAVSVAVSLLIIRKRPLPFSFTVKDIRPRWQYIRQIVTLGAPIALQDLLVNLSFLVVGAIVNTIGLTASAGVGVAEKLCGFIMLVPSSYMQAMSAFVAQNMGAGKPQRARKALLCGIASSLAVGFLMAYVNFFHGDFMSSLFAVDPDVIAASAEYLKAYAIDCLLTSFLFCFVGYFNGTGNTLFVMIQGIVGAVGVRLVLSFVISRRTSELFLIGLATPASSLVQILLCGAFFVYTLRKEKKQASL